MDTARYQQADDGPYWSFPQATSFDPHAVDASGLETIASEQPASFAFDMVQVPDTILTSPTIKSG